MPPRAGKILPAIKEIAWRIFEVLFWLFVIANAAGSFYEWVTGTGPHLPKAGDQCGPNYHWGYILSGEEYELSCERDR